MNKKIQRRVVVISVLSALLPCITMAQKKSAPLNASDVTVITSDRLTFEYARQFALFEKNVVVVDPQMKIFADTMLVLFDDDNKAKRIKAEGNVVIVQEDKRAKADVAEYKVDTGEITLTGTPMVTSGRNILTAEVIKFWRDEDRVECKPNSRLIIYPDDDSSRDNLFGVPQRDR